MECGHSELLARASSAKRIACSVCHSKENQVQKNETLPIHEIEISNHSDQRLDIFGTRLDFDDKFSEDELTIRRIAADLASLLDIPVDAVSVNTDASSGRLTITSAFIFLSAKDVARLSKARG